VVKWLQRSYQGENTFTFANQKAEDGLQVKLKKEKRKEGEGKMATRKAPKKYMRKTGKTKGKTISTAARKKYATIVEHKKGPRGGTTRYRFPIPDAAHARNAMARLPQAKGLSLAEKKKIARRAAKFIGMTPAIKKILKKKG